MWVGKVTNGEQSSVHPRTSSPPISAPFSPSSAGVPASPKPRGLPSSCGATRQSRSSRRAMGTASMGLAGSSMAFTACQNPAGTTRSSGTVHTTSHAPLVPTPTPSQASPAPKQITRRSTPTRLPTTPYARSLESSPRTPMTSLAPRSPSTRSPGHLHWTRTTMLWPWPPATRPPRHPHGPQSPGKQSRDGAAHPNGPNLVKAWGWPPWQPPFPGETCCRQWRTAGCTEVNLGMGSWGWLCPI